MWQTHQPFVSLWQFNRKVVSDSLQPHRLQPTRLLCPWDSSGKNTGVGCHFLLQAIFLTQGLNPVLLHCRQSLYYLSHQGSYRGTQQMEHLSGTQQMLNKYCRMQRCLRQPRRAWDVHLAYTRSQFMPQQAHSPTQRKDKGQILVPSVQEEPTNPKINNNCRRISTLPGKILKLEISQETNGHDCRHINRYSIFNSSKTKDVKY